MHILFVHRAFPGQFGPLIGRLSATPGFRCTFASEQPAGRTRGLTTVRYRVPDAGGARNDDVTWPFVDATRRAEAVLRALEARPRLRPDLIVGHSGFGSTMFLRELYDCPLINYFEYYYRPRGSDMDFRPEFPPTEDDVLRVRARNAVILLDLENCDAGYSPTRWQRSLLPRAYRRKIETIFDGVDTAFWRRSRAPRRIGRRAIPPRTRIVTYVARGFEAMRGFDIFMNVARRVARARRDVVFVCVGSDEIFYGGDRRHIGARTFREHALAQGPYDAGRFVFTGTVSPAELARIFSLSDLHVYLTAPFVLSWSLMQALACGCTVLASDTAPVREMIRHGQNGLLAGFDDVERLTALSLRVLDDPDAYRGLGRAAAALVRERYSIERTFPRLRALFEGAVARGGAQGI